MLKTIGISEIIIQSVADTKARYAVYPTKMEGYKKNQRGMLETALEAADTAGIKVQIGLGQNADWWSIHVHEQDWLEHEAEVNSVMAAEILTKYGGHPSFAGWYIPYEFHPLMALSHAQQLKLNHFYQTIAGCIKLFSDKPIMIAPYYNARVSGNVTLSLWVKIVCCVFKNTGIDILALQDSIGAGFNTLDDLDELFAFTGKAAKKIGLTLYAVTETFEKTGEEIISAPQSRIAEQLSRESAYVRHFVAFSIDHYQNANEAGQINLFEDYRRYTQSLKD
jgi:hypothetical protein